MTKHFQNSSAPSKSVLRRRAAVLAVGMGASVALGSGIALAADASKGDVFAVSTAGHLASAVQQQADGQKKAADATVAKKKAANAAAKKRAAAKAAADRKKRAEIAKNPDAFWISPVDHYFLGATFGLAGSHWSHNHSGQDLVVPTGTSVKAAHSGTVVDAGWGGAYGNNIVIKHGDHVYTQYGHLSKIGVSLGQHVNTGQEIARSGSTGNSTGPHLHFETRTEPVYGYAVEPVKFMRDHGVSL